MLGTEVFGQFSPQPYSFEDVGEPRLIETFLNWPDDPDSIVRFTREYGPLKEEAKSGDEFKFDLEQFLATQQQFRAIWRNFRQATTSAMDLMHDLGGKVRFHGGVVTYIAPTLYVYLYADLVTSPKERVRVCWRENCPHPYFIASHHNKQFCSKDCAAENRREWNREWWQTHGQSWRAKRSDKT